jgi:hypothetical protein
MSCSLCDQVVSKKCVLAGLLCGSGHTSEKIPMTGSDVVADVIPGVERAITPIKGTV